MPPTSTKPWEINPVWRPIPGSSQELALDSRADETLYTGSRGPGKTDTQLMRFARRVGMGYGTAWRGVIFDRKYKNLDDLVIKSKKWFPRIFGDRCKFLESKGDYKWVWDTGEELLFRVIEKPSDYDNYHGHEYPFIGWNELTKFPNGTLYFLMMSCNRTSWTQDKDSKKDSKGNYITPPLKCEVFSTCNSKGVGHRWVKKYFIDIGPYGKVLREPVEVFDPKLQKIVTYVRTRVAIFGSYKENIYLDPQYIATLESETDPNTRKSWLEGSWDVVSGGALDDVWNKLIHVVPRFVVPENWRVDRSFDWGSSSPFSVGWWAEANGEEITLPAGELWKGESVFCPPAGTLIRFHEWYGCDSKQVNVGLRMAPGDVAKGIVEREKNLMFDAWIAKQPLPGPADNQITQKVQADVDTIERKMSVHGVRWIKSDKSKGSRKNGLELFRERLLNSVRQEGPGIYFMSHCFAAISTIPILERDEDDLDDIDTDSEDHAYDDTRYRVLAGSNRIATTINVQYAY